MLARHGFLCLTVKNFDNAQRKKNLFTQLKNIYLNQKIFLYYARPFCLILLSCIPGSLFDSVPNDTSW